MFEIWKMHCIMRTEGWGNEASMKTNKVSERSDRTVKRSKVHGPPLNHGMNLVYYNAAHLLKKGRVQEDRAKVVRVRHLG